MSRNYKFHNPEGLYFVSFAVIYWLDTSAKSAQAFSPGTNIKIFFLKTSGTVRKTKEWKFLLGAL